MSELLHRFTILGCPKPKPRPRPGRKFFLPAPAMRYQEHVGWSALQRSLPEGWPADTGRFGVLIKCYFPDRRKRDLDNVAKSVLDGLNRLVWVDDAQVDMLTIVREHDSERPRVEVTVQAETRDA